MYTALKKPRIGDHVRLTGFLGIFEVVRVRPDGSLVDLKHVDLHQTAYIEHEVSAHDLIYVRGPQPVDPCSRPVDSIPQPSPRPTVAAGAQRATSSSNFPPRTAVGVQHGFASQVGSRKS